ncbi:hypothetical protein L510_1676 [Bordetella bronchiseptica MBORD591]|nr:hypothetical protein L510_1676 [Bordetella bronchiseptica MBORD591]
MARQCRVSSMTAWAACWGVVGRGVMPISRSFAPRPPCRAVVTIWLTRAMIGAGVPAGANRPY